MKIVKDEERVASGRYLRILAYGMPGSGKTWLCASAADHPITAPLLYLDYKGMSESLAKKKFKPGTFIHLRIEKFTDFNHVLTWLKKGPGAGTQLDTICESLGVPWPKTLAVDSITEIHRMEVMRLGGYVAPQKNQDVDLQSVGRPQIQDWGDILNEFMMFGDWHFQQIDYHVIMTCLQMTEYRTALDKKGNKVSIPMGTVPAMQGKAAEQLPSKALTVIHMKAKPVGGKTVQWGEAEPLYCTGSVRVSSTVFARDHTGAFPVKMDNPTMPRMALLLAQSLLPEGGT